MTSTLACVTRPAFARAQLQPSKWRERGASANEGSFNSLKKRGPEARVLKPSIRKGYPAPQRTKPGIGRSLWLCSDAFAGRRLKRHADAGTRETARRLPQ